MWRRAHGSHHVPRCLPSRQPQTAKGANFTALSEVISHACILDATDRLAARGHLGGLLDGDARGRRLPGDDPVPGRHFPWARSGGSPPFARWRLTPPVMGRSMSARRSCWSSNSPRNDAPLQPGSGRAWLSLRGRRSNRAGSQGCVKNPPASPGKMRPVPLLKTVQDPHQPSGSSQVLVCVLSNPPTTSGLRTLGRVRQAGDLLGCPQVEVVNLLHIATYRTGGVAEVGSDPEPWQESRGPVGTALDRATKVLLGYGTTEPSGPARQHYRDQVAWLHRQLTERELPTYQVGDGPRHPSRWQRWTFRSFPTVPFPEALKLSLRRTPVVG